jgi:hypothetical protein
MRLYGTEWAAEYTNVQKVIFSIIYSISFSTLLFWVFVPFDLFIVNIIVIQWGCVILTGTTLSGFCAGKMRTVRGRQGASVRAIPLRLGSYNQ